MMDNAFVSRGRSELMMGDQTRRPVSSLEKPEGHIPRPGILESWNPGILEPQGECSGQLHLRRRLKDLGAPSSGKLAWCFFLFLLTLSGLDVIALKILRGPHFFETFFSH